MGAFSSLPSKGIWDLYVTSSQWDFSEGKVTNCNSISYESWKHWFWKVCILPCLKIVCGYNYFLLAHQNCFGFLLKSKICLCFQNKCHCGKRPSIANFFSQQEYFHCLDLVNHFRTENFILTHACTHTHTHTHIWMFTYFALNSGYVKYSSGTRPGDAWSIQLGRYVASTSALKQTIPQ